MQDAFGFFYTGQNTHNLLTLLDFVRDFVVNELSKIALAASESSPFFFAVVNFHFIKRKFRAKT